MATDNHNTTLQEYLHNLNLVKDLDFLKEVATFASQRIIELETNHRVGANKHERTPERLTQRNGYRDRIWSTRLGDLPLRIPELRHGSFFPSLLEPRRRAEKALVAVVQEAYIQGVSTRKVDDLLQALGLTGIDKSTVSRMCQELDRFVEAFRNRKLEGNYTYLWLDAVYLKVRENHRIVNRALVIAIGVRTTGEREILGFAVGGSEEEAFWKDFLRSLVRRGLQGVQLVISDAHEGLKSAIRSVLAGAAWQRCRVHFMRNLLARISRTDKAMVAALVRTVFAQPNHEAAKIQIGSVARMLHSRWPDAERVLLEGEEDILAFMNFPQEHWSRISSTNVLERLNREIRRRTDVVQVFPNDRALLRLTGSVLIETGDEWMVGRRNFSLSSMQKLLDARISFPRLSSRVKG